MSNELILPDSRVCDPHDCVMADLPLSDGKTIRVELEPIFCFNCGKSNGYVPRDIMSFVSWLCEACSETWGVVANDYMSSDETFWRDVQAEMLARFGRVLTQAELDGLAEQDRLGPALKKLERESPYKL